MQTTRSIYRGFCFPPEVIAHAVFLYHRFPLSLRDVEDLLAQRGIAVSYETIRRWCRRFGPHYARNVRRQRPTTGCWTRCSCRSRGDVSICGAPSTKTAGCVATFQKRQESDWSSWPGSVSCRHLEQVVDELNLSPNIRTAHPPRLPLPDHVHGLVALDRSPRRVECTKALLGLHASFDRSMILLHYVVQVLDRPVAATASQESFLFHPCNRRAVKAGLVRVDDTGRCCMNTLCRWGGVARTSLDPPQEPHYGNEVEGSSHV